MRGYLFHFFALSCWVACTNIGKIIRAINIHRFFYYMLLGFFYIIMPVIMMINLGVTYQVYERPPFELFYFSPLFPCAIVFSIWINDTMAYLVGSFAGKTPLTKVSPKKTWEGTIGGAILCMVTISLLGSLLPVAQIFPWYHWLMIAGLCALFGTMGDLLESKLKRLANVKDSGRIMPGHGGFSRSL